MKPALCLLVALSLALVPLRCPAEDAVGQIVVVVNDVATRTPIANARVVLHGTDTASSSTDKRGAVRYTNVPAGSYRVRVMKTGYADVVTAYFDVDAGKIISVSAGLAGKGLRVIGTVSTRSSASVSSRDTLADGTTRRITDSLADALDKAAGVSVNQGVSNGPVTISLRGRDESQTGIAIDGVPLAPPGTPANLRGMGTDVFSSAQVDFGASAGSLGGVVNFQSLQPTQTWRQDLSGSLGSFDRSILLLSASGKVGPVDVAAQHAQRTSNSPETFNVFEDQSGLRYPHAGQAKSVGDLIKLQYHVNDRTTIGALGLISNATSAPLCTQFGGNLPCGFGPGNTDTSKAGFFYVRAQSLVGNVTLSGTVSSTSGSERIDDANRRLGGTAFPDVSTSTTVARSAQIAATAVQGRHAVTLSASSIGSQSAYANPLRSSLVPLSAAAPDQAAVARSFRTMRLVDVIASSERVALRGAFSVAGATGIGSTLLGAVGATWRPTRSDVVDASFDVGSAQPVAATGPSLSDPLYAAYDCTGAAVTVLGGADPPRNQSSQSAQLGWSHSGRFGRFRVDLYRQTQSGQPFSAAVDAANEPAGYLSGTYLQALDSMWHLPVVCGRGAPAVTRQNVYIVQSLTNTSRLYEGVDLSGRISLGRRFIAYPTYSLNVAKLTGADTRLTGPRSTYIIGSQLPDRPLHRLGLTVSGEPLSDGLEVIGNVQWTAANNVRHLGPYTSVNAGLSQRLGNGRFTFFATNLFNTEAGTFATVARARTEATTSGSPLLPLAYPLQPRTFNVGYQIRVGGPPPESVLGVLAAGARGRGSERGSGSILTGSPRAPSPQFGPAPAGADPLSLATYRPGCDPEAQRIAIAIVSDLRAYLAAFAATIVLPSPRNFVVVPRANALRTSAFWFELRGKPAAQAPTAAQATDDPERAVGCFYISSYGNEEARAKGIVTAQPAIGYTADLGLFYVRPVELPPGGGSLRR